MCKMSKSAFLSGLLGGLRLSSWETSLESQFNTAMSLGGTLDVDGSYISAAEASADPSDPAEGNWVIWMSDGTGLGDDGDIMMLIQANSTLYTNTLVDVSGL